MKRLRTVAGSVLALLFYAAIFGPALAAQQPAAPEVMPPDVVVIAPRKGCSLTIANRIISDREFQARAKEWAAGRAVQIVVPPTSSYVCKAKILFRLQRYGVTRAEFVEQRPAP